MCDLLFADWKRVPKPIQRPIVSGVGSAHNRAIYLRMKGTLLVQVIRMDPVEITNMLTLPIP